MSNLDVISERALSLKPSLTLEISSLAQSLKQKGRDICSLSAGEPDFDTPNFIVEAAKKALDDGITKYGPAGGDPSLREEVAKKLTEINDVPTSPENVLITNGGKQAIFNLLQVIINPGDEVLIPSPYWLSYPEITKIAGGIPITINSSKGNSFSLDIEEIEKNINHKTKLLILNSPCNPTGRIIQESELQSIANLLRKHPNIYVMSDEIYEFLITDKEVHISLASIAPDLKDKIFIVNGFAKAWAMTGWRVGYLQGSSKIIKKAIALQSQSTSNVCSFAQRGALAAIKGAPKGIDYMIQSYNERRKLLTEELRQISSLSLEAQSGAFYAFPKLSDELPDSLSFCKIALEKEGLAIVPGIAFGNDRCIRLSCSVNTETLNDGITRLNRIIKDIT
ncbi:MULTISPECIES: pyridoxal phosphate-dependent aminotransferase [Prochlorococcus]|uniref:Aminotransferase n=1 Tax=Prochlorococcus marinus (strain SARG / CCMP1375 / SS120) TaxID=167539 RepID=Q7VBS4_PROMA|nr:MULTISPECIES: pyridoxal phosphate-dependent aminotransferase [Prochlorococcus]AAQ00063.1 Aspartate aminotransferase family enzyme [Prochlorococcus marinus subsp. marinus str. CCMP1375]KGG13860.1 Aspartate aminotransferase [Prochlorococcus marinus str. LG]KGG18993.1 Aspartate aminotransferase [Prochlorococcus marinus str. SS2]KGG23467.1 Aspartate aminotransferase [Prochlorococcus marinus str. SS35]KGG32297.1 Aspartate aminotransferase [Prochlorococcus marinus str. SS51]